MANTSDPKAIAEQIEQLAHALKNSKEFMDSFTESLNIAKTLMLDVRKVFKTPGAASPLLQITRQVSQELKKAKTVAQQMNALKNAEVQYQALLNSGIVFSNKQLSVMRDSLEGITKMRSQLGRAALAESLGFKKAYTHFFQLAEKGKNFSGTLQAAGHYVSSLGGKFGKVGKVASVAGRAMSGLGAAMAGMSIPLIGLVVAAGIAIKEFVHAVWNVFKKADEAGTKFRMTMGFIRSDTALIDKDIRNIAISLTDVGANFEMAYGSVTALVATMGSMTAYTKETAHDITLFTAQLGVAADKSAQVLKAFAMISKSTMQSQRNMLGFTMRLSAAAGTNLQEVMSDIAEFSSTHYRFMRGSAMELAKAAVDARRMGTNLGSAGKTAGVLLNFTQSITDEMEASVLAGRSIDAQRARSLAWAGKMEDLNKEILRLAEQHGFEFMDPKQMEAFARLFGKTEEEISKMVQAERQHAAIQAELTKDSKLRAREAHYKKMIDMSKAQAESAGKQYITDLQRQANQERIVSLQNQWNKLIAQLAEDWLPVIDDFFKAAVPTLRKLSQYAIVLSQKFMGMAKVIGAVFRVITDPFNPESWTEGWKLAVDGVVQYTSGQWKELIKRVEEDIKPGSPHRLGQMYLDGFKAAGPGIERALVSPISASAKEAAAILAEAGMITPSIEGRTPPGIGAITPIAPIMERNRLDNISFASDEAVMKVVESINKLREDMVAGKLGATVRLDSQELVMGVDRQTRFRKGIGTNTV